MNAYLFIIFLLHLLFGSYNHAYFTINDVRNYLGSRTPYRFKANKNDSRIGYPSCKDTKIWMIIRHGTRLPSNKDINSMNTTLRDLKYKILLQHKLGKGTLNKDQLTDFEEWVPRVKVGEEKFLAFEGQDEMVLLAERMQKRFPGAIKQKYNNKTFLFRYTATQRAQQSAKYFTNGLFEKKDAQNVIYAPVMKNDTILRFYKYCDKWQTQVKKNPKTYMEQKLFGFSKEMNDSLKSVSVRLGFDEILSLDTVVTLYKTCGYETAWRKHYKSPWCSAFDERSAKVLEYYMDLKHYWLDSYGYGLTYRQACLSVRHMFDNFSEKREPSATFLFAHSGTILKILSHMELFKPESPLRGDKLITDRVWRTSDIDCFASNIAFVLFSCKDGLHVLTLHQEKIIKLPMCEKELCPLEHLRQHFYNSIHNCDYNDICSLDTIKKGTEDAI